MHRLGDAEVAARELTRSEPSHIRAVIHRHVDQTDAKLRDQGGGWIWVANLVRDVRYGVRMLRKRPGFTTVAVLSLVIGIGANTAIFSLVDTIILRELPYDLPEELVNVYTDTPRDEFWSLSYPDFEDLRDGTAEVFSKIAAVTFAPAPIDGARSAEVALSEVVTGEYFSMLGIEALLGRTIWPEDDVAPGAHPVVMLSYGYWQSAFGQAHLPTSPNQAPQASAKKPRAPDSLGGPGVGARDLDVRKPASGAPAPC